MPPAEGELEAAALSKGKRLPDQLSRSPRPLERAAAHCPLSAGGVEALIQAGGFLGDNITPLPTLPQLRIVMRLEDTVEYFLTVAMHAICGGLVTVKP